MSESANDSKPTSHRFEAEVSQVLRLVVDSLYSNPEVFLRELISNSSDALDKLRFQGISNPELLDADDELHITIQPDAERGVLIIEDNGIGMTRDEMVSNLGTIARSGSRQLVEALKAKGDAAPGLIGRFGVGFYSAFLVATRVDVESRSALGETAHRWSSDAVDGFEIEPIDRDDRGTRLTLHLKEDAKEYLEPTRLRQLVQRYSDYVPHVIRLAAGDDEPEQINRASALWQQNPKEVELEQYEEFYKHLSHDWQPPLAHRHFRIEGTQLFSGVLFIPKQPAPDLFDPTANRGLRLHVRRVFVMDDCAELLPRWLRFVRGVIDSDDLPLNVSREILQDSRIVRTMRQQVVRQTLGLLEQLADEKPNDYEQFNASFGAVLKEGLHFDPDLKDRLAKLARFGSTTSDKPRSLQGYVDDMPEGQDAIYYAVGESKAALAASPQLEGLRKAGTEVLLMTDAVDPFVVAAIEAFSEHPLRSAMAEEAESDDSDDDTQDTNELKPLLERFERVLGDRVAKVVVSTRLTESPACLVQAKGGIDPHLERMLRAQQLEVPASKRVLELNPQHALVKRLAEINTEQAERAAEWVEVLYAQALLAEGTPPDDPADFAKRLTKLLTESLGG